MRITVPGTDAGCLLAQPHIAQGWVTTRSPCNEQLSLRASLRKARTSREICGCTSRSGDPVPITSPHLTEGAPGPSPSGTGETKDPLPPYVSPLIFVPTRSPLISLTQTLAAPCRSFLRFPAQSNCQRKNPLTQPTTKRGIVNLSDRSVSAGSQRTCICS